MMKALAVFLGTCAGAALLAVKSARDSRARDPASPEHIAERLEETRGEARQIRAAIEVDGRNTRRRVEDDGDKTRDQLAAQAAGHRDLLVEIRTILSTRL